MKVGELKARVKKEGHSSLSMVNTFVVAYCKGKSDDEGIGIRTRVMKSILGHLETADERIDGGIPEQDALKMVS